jgi:hypothetical protein
MTVSVSIEVSGNVVRSMPNVPWFAGMTGQNALEGAYASGTGYSFVLQYFGASLGYEVMAFDGISAQQGTDVSFYWEFFYNGNPAQQGIDGTILNDGDALLFSYVSYDVAQHAGRRVEAVHKAIRARARSA